MRSRGVDPTVEKKLVELSEGVYIEEDVLGIVARIQEYDENLTIQMVDTKHPDFKLGDAPFRLMEECPDGLRRPVMDIWDLDARVLDRIMAADTHKGSLLAELKRINDVAEKAEKRRYREEVAAVSEMVQGVLRSPKDTYTATNPVTGEDHTFTALKKSD